MAAVVLFVFAANLASGDELSIHAGTALLMLGASVLVLFHKQRGAKAKSIFFLCATSLTSHAVDKYFWFGVWDHGYPWPYSIREFQGYGFIGSISPFMNQVATVTFAIAGALALVLMGWHLTRLFSGPPSAAAKL
ncbi:MAG: hypothetical protein O9341_03010 [Paucibacter sp.]|nr:hypothetical protein [Roseateles sp.]